MKTAIYDFMSGVFLFQNIEKDTLFNLLDAITPEIKTYSAKEPIYSPSEYEKKIGFVLSGECSVERVKCDGTTVPLNTVRCGGSFGIMAILSKEDDFPTRVTATKSTNILFINERDTEYLIEKNSTVAKNVIKFLSEKITFLNQKIATFSSATVEEKLASYIFCETRRRSSLEFPFNCKRTAEAISAGRASLYRALAALGDSGIIKLENKKIYIIDPEGLERISK